MRRRPWRWPEGLQRVVRGFALLTAKPRKLTVASGSGAEFANPTTLWCGARLEGAAIRGDALPEAGAFNHPQSFPAKFESH
jgi:hypothetical protein